VNFFTQAGLVFRKYPLIRIALVLFFIGLSFFLSFFLTSRQKKIPEIELLDPAAAIPGDIIAIYGKNFGTTRGTSSVEISGDKLTSSSYISWDDDKIRILLPQNIQDGLVYVETQGGRSEPKIFANKIDIPVQINTDRQNAKPQIFSVSGTKTAPLEILTITGKNFGISRGDSQIFFSSQTDGKEADSFITCTDSSSDYEFWGDQEIRVRIPDGASSGRIFIRTDKTESNYYNIVVDSEAHKTFSDNCIYLISLSANISDIVTTSEGNLTLRIPKPPVTSYQRSVEVTVSNPEPVIPEYMNTIVHQFTVKKNPPKKISVNHNMVVSVWATNTSINPVNIRPLSDKSRNLYAQYLYQDNLVPSSDEKVTELARNICQKETNPYLKAKKIFTYMIENFKVETIPEGSKRKPLDLISKKSGDSYDFSVIFSALCRAGGIPCINLSGILVDSNQNTKNHFWNEIFLEKAGWIPVDCALGSGMEYEAFKKHNPDAFFYFGNLDSQHILFSRGWNELKPSQSTSKTVYRPRSYALQSIWEESSQEIQKYSSFWSNVQVQGIY
jgi:hypothetical protein